MNNTPGCYEDAYPAQQPEECLEPSETHARIQVEKTEGKSQHPSTHLPSCSSSRTRPSSQGEKNAARNGIPWRIESQHHLVQFAESDIHNNIMGHLADDLDPQGDNEADCGEEPNDLFHRSTLRSPATYRCLKTPEIRSPRIEASICPETYLLSFRESDFLTVEIGPNILSVPIKIVQILLLTGDIDLPEPQRIGGKGP